MVWFPEVIVCWIKGHAKRWEWWDTWTCTRCLTHGEGTNPKETRTFEEYKHDYYLREDRREGFARTGGIPYD